VEQLQKLLDDYNAGSVNVEAFFQQLIEFTQRLNEEGRLSLAESLDEEQLAIYDLLMRPALPLTNAEELEASSSS